MRKGQNSRRGRGRNGGMRPNNNNQAMNAGMNAGNYQQHRHNPNNGHQGGQGNRGGGGRRNPGMLNRSMESSGPEGKVRGTALQLYERYKTLARENQASDRVLAETFGQFADHYYRLAAEYGAFEAESQQRPEGQDRGFRQQGDATSDMMGDAGGDTMADTAGNEAAPDMASEAPSGNLADGDTDEAPVRSQERSERSERSERPERFERYERHDRSQRPERAANPDRQGGQDRVAQDRFAQFQDRPSPRPSLDAGVLRTLGNYEAPAPATPQPAAPQSTTPAQQPSLLDGMGSSGRLAAHPAEPVEGAEMGPEGQKRRRGRPRKDATAAAEEAPAAAPTPEVEAASGTGEGEAPRRRGRPRKTPEAASA